MSGPREEDGDYAREFFDAYERAGDELVRATWPTWVDRDEGVTE